MRILHFEFGEKVGVRLRLTLGCGAIGALNTVGNVLHTILPSLFPSQHTATLAVPVMHGAVLPLGAPVEEVYRVGAGLDGWVGVVIRML